MSDFNQFDSYSDTDIAIIGMAGRFPGANDIHTFWHNIQHGVDVITHFSDEELAAAGVSDELLNNPDYVKSGFVLDDIECFDASFFGYSPRDAEVLDPQQRFFLECAWSALEDAGYDPKAYKKRIGVYGGAGFNTYVFSFLTNLGVIATSGVPTVISNDKDYLTTRVSYKLNLKGPSLTVQTACSTSLVAVHLACQNLLNGECDMALAGGVSIIVPHRTGYLYQEGGIFSPEGRCRAFDAGAQGIVSGNGVGIVVLKRLADAIADGDTFHAVIKGSAINNDGSSKMGYTAPSISGQAEVIAEAQAVAGVEPETISYIETHGTGTVVGDPIEIAALNNVFLGRTDRKAFCALGSVKTNIGHLDAAAGVVGLIKTVMAFNHKLLPPNMHFEQPNPQIDWENSPFFVNAGLSEWKAGPTPRRAGVSSFGIGGTNAHIVLEEAPPLPPSSDSRPWQLLVLSAKTETALDSATINLGAFLRAHPDINLADAAATLQTGRQAFAYRRMLLCADLQDAVNSLESFDPTRLISHTLDSKAPSMVFMFPGGGAQYAGMARDLYQGEPIFRAAIDRCAELLIPQLKLDLRELLYPSAERFAEAEQQLERTLFGLPALFVTSYALAQLWMSWGIQPEAMIGHSLGEYVAACLSGVFSLEDALALVVCRSRLFEQLPAGSMLTVALPAEEIRPILSSELSLAAINAPALCVVSGTAQAIEALQQTLADRNIETRRVHIAVAGHSALVDPILDEFTAFTRTLTLHAPTIPYISNVTGTWIRAQEATDPEYWARHLRHTVCFADGMRTLLETSTRVLLEVGPGRGLSSLAKQYLRKGDGHSTFASTRHRQDKQSDSAFLLTTLGRLWLVGSTVDWAAFYADERRRHISLPTYPFERQRFWVDQSPTSKLIDEHHRALSKRPDIADWFYVPAWRRSRLVTSALQHEPLEGCWIVFGDMLGVGAKLAQRVAQAGCDVVTVTAGERFAMLDRHTYTINPRQRADYDALFDSLATNSRVPAAIVHLWGVTTGDESAEEIAQLEYEQYLGFYSLIFLAQALSDQNMAESVQISVVTNNMQDVIGDERLCPGKTTVLAPCKVIPREYPDITCRSIDLALTDPSAKAVEKIVEQLSLELTALPSDAVVAYRGSHRWVEAFQPISLEQQERLPSRLRDQGVYLITGGLGGIGLELAEYLARTVQARLVLLDRLAFPQRDEWAQWLATHDQHDDISRKIVRLEQIEQLGAEVLLINADVADRQQMADGLARTLERFGTIHGVVHGAGVAHGGMIQLQTPELAARVLTPKLTGTLVLAELLQEIKLDFLALFSSVSSILGDFGQVDYCASNLFLDAFAPAYAARTGTFTVSINWDAWQGVGMAVEAAGPQDIKELRERSLETAILPQEGVEAFVRALSDTAPQIIVSTRDFEVVVEQYRRYNVTSALEELEQVRHLQVAHPRPAQRSAYVAPRDAVEEIVAGIWQDLLGIEQVGVHDDFLELGGHSLLATQVIARVRDTFQINLPLASIFETPTVAGLAVTLLQHESAPGQVITIARLRQQIDAMSAEEIRSVLEGQV